MTLPSSHSDGGEDGLCNCKDPIETGPWGPCLWIRCQGCYRYIRSECSLHKHTNKEIKTAESGGGEE